MNCHKTGGKGEGWFQIAGSVYGSDLIRNNPNGKILLFTQPNGKGELKHTIEVDALGNFYTTKEIDFNSGLYPAHQNQSGNLKFMETTIPNGECQSCHGVSTDRIWNE